VEQFVGFFIGAVIGTGLVTVLLHAILRKWDGGLPRIITINIASLAIITVIGGFGAANGGEFAGFTALKQYALPQGIWLVLMLIGYVRKRREQARAGQPR
jgi:hypothetical protein